MNIWLPDMDVPPPVTNGLCKMSRYYDSPEVWLKDHVETGLIRVGNDQKIPATGDSDVRWYVPAGQGGNTFLLRELKQTQRPIYVAVNGLGQHALEKVRAELSGASATFIFDARNIPDQIYYQQLVWLSAQPEPFGVVVDTMERMNIAVMQRPAQILYPEPGDYDFSLLMKLVSLFGADSIRPISADEVDQLSASEISLSVVRPRLAGMALQTGDLCTVVASDRGLSPALEAAVTGKILRYDIAPGEPLTFGHFVES
jgi:hypothetical protein